MQEELKTYDMLSSYAISETGEVIDLEVMDNIELSHDPVRKEIMNYKLLTDEKVQLTNKTIRLWRRFTVDDIKKMYKSDRAKPLSEASISYVPLSDDSVQVECTTKENVPLDKGKSVPLLINGIVYQSLRDATTQLGVHRNTIKKRLEDPLNEDYTYTD